MKTLKVTSVVALVLGGLLVYSYAHDAKEEKATEHPRGPTITNRAVLRMVRELNLRDDQKTKVNAIYEAEASQTQELLNATSLPPARRREKYAAEREAAAKKMKEVLTPEQHAKWQELQGLHGRRSAEASSGKKADAKKSE